MLPNKIYGSCMLTLFNVLLPVFVGQCLEKTCNITHLLISQFLIQLQLGHLAYSFIERFDFPVMELRCR